MVKEIIGHHSYDWIIKILVLLSQFEPIKQLETANMKKVVSLRFRLKLIMILINQVVTTIFAKYHNDAVSIIEGIYSV
jgi:hypothetical protein